MEFSFITMNNKFLNKQEMFVEKLVAYVYKQQPLLNNANLNRKLV